MKNSIGKINIRYILIAVLALEIALIVIGGILRTPKLLDDDMSMLYVHVIEMAKNKTFVIPGWSFINSMEIDGPAILAMPLYLITRNIYISFSISILLFMMLWVWTVFRIFRFEKKEYAILSLILIFIPYGFGFLDYFNMLFIKGAYYIIKVLLPLMLISILVLWNSKNELNKREEIVFTVIYLLLLFTTTFSSGVYVAACGIFPILCLMFLRFIITKEPLSKYIWGIMIASVVAIGAGFLGTRLVGVELHGNNMLLCTIYDMPENIIAVFFGIFELFKGAAYDEVAILSAKGIHKFLRICFTCLLLSGVGISISKWKKEKLSLINQLLLSVFIWNTIVLCLTNITNYLGTAEFRYHLIGSVPLLCILAQILYDDIPKLIGKKYGIVFAGLMLLYLNVSSFGIFYSEKNPNEDLERVCSYISTQEFDNVYFLNDMFKAEICQLIDETPAEYLNVDFNGNVLVRDYYDHYNNETIDTNNAILVVNTDIWEIETKKEYKDAWVIQDSIVPFGGQFEKIESFGFFDVYKSAKK